MGRKIILLSDGTGNAASSIWRTNVWRVFESLDLTGSDQVAFYDDGVGTSPFKPLAIIGGAFGYGLKHNVIDLYKFVCRNHHSNGDHSNEDEIFGFGFSRGAFTIRMVVGLIVNQGLVRYDTEDELDRKAKAAYREFRREKFHSKNPFEILFRWLRRRYFHSTSDKSNKPVDSIRFLGLWDTVAAYGLPVDEMTRGISQWIWPLEFSDRYLDNKVRRACHALSLDDERTTFHPVLWTERGEIPARQDDAGNRCTRYERISQVWFAGMHANVGGGYPDDALAHVPLNWIVNEARQCGLRFKTAPEADPDSILQMKSMQDKDGRLYDSRNGLGGYYRYGPRKLADLCQMQVSANTEDKVEIELPKIHESALQRIQVGAQQYAPIGLPEKYELVTEDGRILSSSLNSYETPQQASHRCLAQEDIWDIVWQRRVVYFLTVFASLYLVIYPLYRVIPPSNEYATKLRLISDTIRLLGAFLPSNPWLEAYARDPAWFLVTGLLVGFLIWLGSKLGGQITDQMGTIWRNLFATEQAPSRAVAKTPPGPQGLSWYLVVGISLYVALYPFLHGSLTFLYPKPVDEWLKDYTGGPIRIIFISLLLIFLIPKSYIRTVRSSAIYKWVLQKIRLSIAPSLFVIFFVYLGITLVSHLAFNIEDNLGHICRDTKHDDGKPLGENDGLSMCENENLVRYDTGQLIPVPPCENRVITFDTKKICVATGLYLEAGGTYLFKLEKKPKATEGNIKIDDAWSFAGIKSNTGGLHLADIPTRKQQALMIALYPLKRSFIRPWFRVITRYGSGGTDENFIDPDPVPDPAEILIEKLKPRRNGELFLYLNNPVLGLWGLENVFHQFNTGVAKITVERVRN